VIVLPNHVLPAGTAILEPTPHNWRADDASRGRTAARAAATPRRQLDDEADLENAVMNATPTLTAGTVTAGPHP
jgi:hypothetical protein